MLISFAVTAKISFAVTAKLICLFVFAYAKIRFSHDAAQIRMKSLDPLKQRQTFIRKKEDGPDGTVSDN